MQESSLLSHIAERSRALSARFPDVLIGPGDDCGVVRSRAGALLLTVDQLVEDRHFAPSTPDQHVARKAVARSMSDLAAMAAHPAWALATAALPTDSARWSEPRVSALFDAMASWAEHWHCPLVGGDIATLPPAAPAVFSIALGGYPACDRGPVLRSGARAGDELWVTGRIGGSLASGRHLLFEPRLAESAWLAGTLGPALHAMIDISDGLGRDAARLADASSARLELHADDVPLHPDAGGTPFSAGEDYELLFAVAPGSSLPACTPNATPLTRIGRVTAGRGCVLIGPDGRATDASELGWDHR